MSAEFTLPATIEHVKNSSLLDRVCDIATNARIKLGRVAAAGLLAMPGAVVAYTTGEVIDTVPAFAYDTDTGDYPWRDAIEINAATSDYGYETCPESAPKCKTKTVMKDNKTYGVYDPWNYYFRNCTSYVAWRLAQDFTLKLKPGESTAATTLARPAVIAYNGALNVFIRGGDNQIYAQHWNGNTWTGFASIGGNMKSDPALVENNGALNVFAIGQDGQVHTKYNDGNGWSGWASMGPQQMKGNPFVIRYGTEINLFALGNNNVPYKNTWQPNTSWSGWVSMGNFMDSSPSAVQHGSNLNVVMRGGDSKVYNNRWNGAGWSGFGDLGCCLAGNPDTISYGGFQDVWAISSGGGLWKKTWNGNAWGGWTWMGDGFHGNPDAMQYNSDLNVFARGGNGQVYHRYWSASGQSWSSWSSIDSDTPVAGDPTAIQYGSELSVFATSSDDKTYKNTYHPGSGWGGFHPLPD